MAAGLHPGGDPVAAGLHPGGDPVAAGLHPGGDPVAAALHRPPIGEQRVLGDGRSVALVGPEAEVGWWCAPEVDSPPLLWWLLDPAGASARWIGTRLVERSTAPARPVARTVLRHSGGTIECRDALVTGPGGPALVRLVRSPDSPLDIVHHLGLGGFDAPAGTWDGARWHGGGVTVEVAGGVSAGAAGAGGRPVLATSLWAPPGQWAALVVALGQAFPADATSLLRRLEGLERGADRRLARSRLPRHHPDRAADALCVLEACTYEPTGAVVAAPTTSLPEAPGADRQFDYRYTWLRDASLGISVAALLGRRDVARRYLDFANGLAEAGGPPDTPLTDVRGGPAPGEREVPGVAGWAGSQPVRVGNGARHQVQHDALGLLLEGVSVYLQTGGSLDRATWRLVRQVADRAADAPPGAPTSGIWELRRPADLVSADIGRWIALDRAVWIARGWRPWARRRRWVRARHHARARVVGAIRPDGGLPQAHDGNAGADASALMAVVFGLLDPGDPRAAALVDSVLDRLGAGPFLYRYEPGGDDGFSGCEGAFLPVSWWAVSALAVIGRVDDAQERAGALCAALPRLMAEEVDPRSGESLGNAPLVWSHAEAARAMYVLDAARIRARFGAPVLWAWRLARYVRLRGVAEPPPGEEGKREVQP